MASKPVAVEPVVPTPVSDPLPPAEPVQPEPLPPAEPLPTAQEPPVLDDPAPELPTELTDEQELDLLGEPEPDTAVDPLPAINPATGLPQTTV